MNDNLSIREILIKEINQLKSEEENLQSPE